MYASQTEHVTYYIKATPLFPALIFRQHLISNEPQGPVALKDYGPYTSKCGMAVDKIESMRHMPCASASPDRKPRRESITRATTKPPMILRWLTEQMSREDTYAVVVWI